LRHALIDLRTTRLNNHVFVNLTGFPVRLRAEIGEWVFPPAGIVAHVNVQQCTGRWVGMPTRGYYIGVGTLRLENVVNLPPQDQNVVYIASRDVVEWVRRDDVVYAANPYHEDNGSVVYRALFLARDLGA
jgi:hypothetical protein